MANDNKQGTALATRPKQELVGRDGRPIDHVITKVDELVDAIATMRERYHVVSPVMSTTAMAPGFGAVLTVVDVDTSTHSRDFYPLKSKQKETNEDLFGPSKLLINRIGAAAGVTWLPFPYSMRTDDRKTKWVWEFTSTGEYWAPDGKRLRITGTKEVDLRDGSALALTMTPAQLRQARPFGLELAETKSQLRALRRIGISQNYTMKELAKPFVVVQFTFKPDMSNEAVALEVTRHYLGIRDQLYGHSLPPGHDLTAGDDRPALPPSSARELPAELGGAAPSEASKTAASASGPRDFDDDASEEEQPPRFRVTRVLDKDASGDFTIFLGDGSQLKTGDVAVAKAANRALKNDRAITFNSTQGRIDELLVLEEPAPALRAQSTEAEAEEVEDDGLRVLAKVDPRHGTSPDRKDPTKKKAWTLFTIIATTGESWTTFSKTHADLAQEAIDKGWKVRISGEPSERYPDQTDLTDITLIDPRQGTLPVGDGNGKY